jgi:transposase
VLSNSIPQSVVDSLRGRVQRIKQLAIDIKDIEVRLAEGLRIGADMKRVAAVPGAGLLSATAAIATVGEAKAFKSGAILCLLGLVPRQRGAVGPLNLLGSPSGATPTCAFCFER